METHQEKLIGIVRYQLFGGAKPQIDENELPAILKEASQQTVYTMIFPFLRDAIIKYSPEKFAQKTSSFSETYCKTQRTSLSTTSFTD